MPVLGGESAPLAWDVLTGAGDEAEVGIVRWDGVAGGIHAAGIHVGLVAVETSDALVAVEASDANEVVLVGAVSRALEGLGLDYMRRV